MATATPIDQLKDMFRMGSRHQVEKIVIIALYLVSVVLSMAWGFSTSGANNELGAVFGPERIAEIEREVYFLENSSDDHWHNVRIILDRRYVYTLNEVKPRARITVGPEKFRYFYYIPRAWGGEEWEQLEKTPRRDEFGPRELSPQYVQIRADEGRLDLKVVNKKGQKFTGQIPD